MAMVTDSTCTMSQFSPIQNAYCSESGKLIEKELRSENSSLIVNLVIKLEVCELFKTMQVKLILTHFLPCQAV